MSYNQSSSAYKKSEKSIPYQIIKRSFDIFIAIFLSIIFLPIGLIIAVLIKCERAGPIFFRQARTGLFEQPFYILKFRTMRHESHGLNITICGDDRVTRLGRALRKTKLDEMPQLLNVLKGDMSIVGPRPEVVSHLIHYEQDVRHIIFSERPGITDLASLLYIHEERLLAESNDPVKTYFEVILPEKNRLRVRHIVQQSILFDIKIVIWTALRILFRHRMPVIDCPAETHKSDSVHDNPREHANLRTKIDQ